MSNSSISDASGSQAENFQMQQDVKGNRNQVIGQVSGGTVVNISGGTVHLNSASQQNPQQPTSIPSNLPRSGVVQFIGRDQKLIDLHNQLQQNDRIAVTAINGMGGIGKTELALQYAIAF